MPNLIMGWRLEGNFSAGDVPFYTMPCINLRGIPLNRYQGNHILQTELETIYKIDDHCAIFPFVVVDSAVGALNEFDRSEPKFADGLGIRYLILIR